MKVFKPIGICSLGGKQDYMHAFFLVEANGWGHRVLQTHFLVEIYLV